MSGDVDVAYSAGRRNGTSAPYQRATSAISSESVETTTRSKQPLCRAVSIAYARSGWPASGRTFLCGTRSEPERAGTNATAEGRAHRSPAATASSVSVGQGTPSRSAVRSTPPRIASSSERRPAATSRAAEVVVSSAISSMIAHCAAGRSETPSASATEHASTMAASSFGRHSGSVAQLADGATGRRRRRRKRRDPRELVPEHALLVLADPYVDPRAPEHVGRLLHLARVRLSEAIVITGDGVASMICTRPAR